MSEYQILAVLAAFTFFYSVVAARLERTPVSGAVVYALIVIAGLVTADERRVQILSLTVLLTLVAYLAYAIYQSWSEQVNKEKEQVSDQLAVMREERLMVNAETRKLRAENQQNVSENLAKPSKMSAKSSEFTAVCDRCGWSKNYQTARGATNGLNGHRRVCKEK